MICKNCNGKIKLSDGKAVCMSCGSSYELNYGFNNIEVAVVNTVSAKDQKIAEDIYYTLDRMKIKVFQKKLSSGGMDSDDQEGSLYQALYNCNIILLVGTSKEIFEEIMDYITEFIGKKTIIPVYSSMDAYELPKALGKYQAQNYDKIAALKDLSNAVESILGKKKKKIPFSMLWLVMLVLVLAIIFTLVIANKGKFDKKETEVNKTEVNKAEVEETTTVEEQATLSEQDIYDQAKELYDDEKYMDAYEKFSSITNYKDVESLVKIIYSKYDGYYQSEDLTYTFYISISGSRMAKFSFEKNDLDGKVIFTESAEMSQNTISAVFQDTEDGKGNINIKLSNDAIEVSITQEGQKQTIGSINLSFKLSDQKDKPMEKGITKEQLHMWLDNRSSLTEIKRTGCDIKFEKNLTAGGGTLKDAAVYYIENSDIKMLFLDYDLANLDNYWDISSHKLDDFYLYAILGPANLVLGEYRELTLKPYISDKYTVVPSVGGFVLCGDGGGIEYCAGFYFTEESKIWTKEPLIENKVKDDTAVGIICNNQVGSNSSVILSVQNKKYESVYK